MWEITHSAKETRQQKEQCGGGWEGGWTYLKKGGVGSIGG